MCLHIQRHFSCHFVARCDEFFISTWVSALKHYLTLSIRSRNLSLHLLPHLPLSLYCHPFFFSSLLHLISIQRKEFTCKFFHRQSFNTMSYITVRQPWLPVHVIKCQMYVIKIDIMCTCAPALLSTSCNVICLHIM